MDEEAKKELLSIARKSIEAVIYQYPVCEFHTDNPEIQGNQGAFVTLKNKGKLRGCIGRFRSDIPLYKLISEVAISSATEDTRFMFNPITPPELNDIKIEISVLSPLEKIDDPLNIILGVHGIYIKKGEDAGCFLPQVATETGWDKEEFLSQCCRGKAGLSPDAWREKDTEVFIFTAEIFGEETLC